MSGNLQLKFASLSPAWWKLIIIGQYTGIGQRKAFGWGRYQIVTGDGAVSYRRPLAACSMLTEAAREDNLARAWRHVMAGDDYALFEESDSVAWHDDELMENAELIPEAPMERLKKDLQKLLEGKYSIPTLKGRLLPKKDGGLRPLAVPPIYDRVLHRACAQILSPPLEQLMYRHSHGFRPGRSRITASYEIQAAWRAGYRWVYESDIKNFFDSVNLERLKERLRAIYGNNPIVRCVIDWLKAPVVFQGQLIERVNGLPQGSPLSPLMANLMLDGFDSDMESAGFKLIRFADDFIVLCKDSLQATQAAKAAEASLAEHGLDLNEDKTRITAMDEGFKYLGYLFVNDMALDISGAKADSPELSSNSWLAQFGEQEPLRLTQEDLIARLAHQLGHNLAINIGERKNEGLLLALTGDPAKLTTLNKHLQIFRNDKRIYDQSWNSLQVIILFGNHQITTQAMHAAMEHDISIHLAKGNGSYQGVVTHHRASQGHQLWLHQMLAFRDPDKALYCAREVVGSRLRHMKEALRRRQKAHHTPILDNAIKRLHHTNSLEDLRGLEGSATAEYFQLVAQLIPDQFSFEGRNRRPPRDPFNVLLSIGYTVLYGYTESVLHAVGLLPWQGFYHQARGRHATLASDLMEPFRHLVERSALTVLLRKELNPEDFTYTPAGACRIDNKARRKYLALFLQRWESAVRAKGEIDAHPYFQHLYKQALSLKDFIQKGQPFKAWNFR
ncbi:MAG: CRISPR-associated endonuclease Cas1 [Methylococcales bacterium]